MYPVEFEEIIAAFQKLPGVGAKSAERFAFTLLNMSKDERDAFLAGLRKSRSIRHCEICGNISSERVCSICSDPDRDKSLICVVKSPNDVATFEKLDEYNGTYHVLNGMINTQKGILPDQLNIDSLLPRLTKENVKEVIVALNPTIEGETTSLYLSRLLKDAVKVSRLAYGIPMGSNLDYLDSLTLKRAYEGRTSDI